MQPCKLSSRLTPQRPFTLITLSSELLHHIRYFHQDRESCGDLPISMGIPDSAHLQKQHLGRGGFTEVRKIKRWCSAGRQLIKTRAQGLFPLTSSHTPAVNSQNKSLAKINKKHHHPTQLLSAAEYQEHEKESPSILTEKRKEKPKPEDDVFLQDS